MWYYLEHNVLAAKNKILVNYRAILMALWDGFPARRSKPKLLVRLQTGLPFEPFTVMLGTSSTYSENLGANTPRLS